MEMYESLNQVQQEAVFHVDGPLLILAGAGSGKTRVLTHRIAYLIEEVGVNPWHILAITFTNKAAGEMRERVDNIVSMGAESIWVSTFHSACVRILRRYADALGYTNSFSIYDTDDQKSMMKKVFKTMDIDTKMYKERAVLSQISSAKNELLLPEDLMNESGMDFRKRKIAEIYKEYQKQLKNNNAMDFDDLIFKTVELLQNNPEILNQYQERFRYIMVDEYQDTNTAQFKLISILSAKYKNLCVVGDDDQSIYKFRGANISNILNFEKTFPGTKVIKLEQNYRSTQNILDAANEVIHNNKGRKEKKLWTSNDQGAKVDFWQFDQAYEEADAIIKDIRSGDYSYEDCAVLYRTNAQSRLLEEKCIAYNIPYRMVGGVNFYQRKEIKDILAYLKTIANGQDDLAVLRIVNVPKRGIGQTSIGKVTMYASANGMSLFSGFLRARAVPTLGKTADKIEKFTDQILEFRRRMSEADYSIVMLINDVLNETGYKSEIENAEETEAEARLENIEELINKAAAYCENAEDASLNGFLEEVALVADVDSLDPNEKRVTLMTLHSAKGLEFKRVYISGMEEGLFPGMMSINSDDPSDLEEERRLCYVGITRAMEHLTLTAAKMRMVNGETRYSCVSRFVDEISADKLNERRITQRRKKEQENNINSFTEKMQGVSAFRPGQNAYMSKTQPSFGKAFNVEKAASLTYKKGDRVKHIKFGEGIVEEIKDGARDYEVTVNFDNFGIKKMFASFAKLQKV